MTHANNFSVYIVGTTNYCKMVVNDRRIPFGRSTAGTFFQTLELPVCRRVL